MSSNIEGFLKGLRDKITESFEAKVDSTEVSPTQDKPSGQHDLTFVNYYIADGFAEDCELLLRRYLKHKIISFEVFRDIFKEMCFTEIFTPIFHKGEAAELSEEIIFIAKQHIFQPKTFEHSVAGLFLTYALIRTQPIQRFAALRLTPNDVPVFVNMMKVAREKALYDVLYVLGSLLIQGPIEFQVANHSYGLERPYRKFFEDKVSINRPSNITGVLGKDSEEKEALRDLSLATRKYMEAKTKITGTTANHSYMNKDLPDLLQRELQMITSIDTESVWTTSDQYNRRQAIRTRAMKDTPKTTRYTEKSRTLKFVRERQSEEQPENTSWSMAKRKRYGPKSSSEDVETNLKDKHDRPVDADANRCKFIVPGTNFVEMEIQTDKQNVNNANLDLPILTNIDIIDEHKEITNSNASNKKNASKKSIDKAQIASRLNKLVKTKHFCMAPHNF